MSPALVSIIVNVYNGERYVAECLDSVLRAAGDIPVQVLVIDDASTDSSEAICRGYVDPRVEYVRLEKNIGAAAAINHAFGLVRGEFVARIDYDDRVWSNWLVDSLAALREHPDAALVCARVRMIDSGGAPAGEAGPADHGEAPGCRDRFEAMLTRHFVTAPTILGRAEHWRRAIPIPPGMNFCDWYMNLTMAEAAPVVVLDNITADYRIHPLNMHTTKVRDGMGERVTREVLDRFLLRSPRAAELAPRAAAIRAFHAADWGNKYFGAGMNAEARRCYVEAIRRAPSMLWRGGFAHRLAGLLVGRGVYERAKSLGRRLRG